MTAEISRILKDGRDTKEKQLITVVAINKYKSPGKSSFLVINDNLFFFLPETVVYDYYKEIKNLGFIDLTYHKCVECNYLDLADSDKIQKLFGK